MKKSKVLNLLKSFLIILLISVIAELLIVVYNFTINKIYNKLHFIGNESIEISKDNIEITEDENSYYLNVNKVQQEKIYNVSLIMNDKNQDVYMRILFNNDAKFIPKENANASKFKVYFVSGLETDKFSITFPKNQVELNNVKNITINDNIDYMPDISFSIGQVIIIFVTTFITYILIKIYKYSNEIERKIKTEFAFLGLSLFIGITFVFINAPQVRYDEHAHFWRAYEISKGNIISRTTNLLPNSIIALFEREDGSYPNKEINYNVINKKINDNLNPTDERVFAVGATGSLTPISYIPQVIGITIGRVLELSPIIILWLGRLTNLLTYIGLIFFAIKIIPSEKWKNIIMIIALFPMSMNLAATVSPDTVIIGCTLLAISYAMYLKFVVEKIELKQISLLGILCMIPTVCKIVYFPLFLVVLMLPKEKFENKIKRILAYVLVGTIVFLPYILLNKLVNLGDYAIAIRTNMMEQCLFTISDIIRDFGVAINTMYSEFSLYLFEMIGGWNTIEIISIIILGILLFEMLIKTEDGVNYKFTKNDKIICIIICMIEILGVVAAMYLGWTQAKQTVVEGVQGRYFLPVIPLICIFLSRNKLGCEIKNKNIKYIIISIILFCIIFGFSIKSYLA